MIPFDWIKSLPKAELHVHIEGTFEPELMFAIASRNGINLPYPSVEALKEAYAFSNLQDFLDIYYQGAQVLLHEVDYYDLTRAYLQHCKEESILHVELFFDPQTHTHRGVAFGTVIAGIRRALEEAEAEWGLSYRLIMCFLRHLSEEAALQTWEQAQPYLHQLHGVGLDSSEQGNPPEKFERVFAKARAAGLKTMAHAGEEGPVAYVWGAIKALKVDRIDHGNRSLDDAALMDYLRSHQMALTLCPLSNLELKVIKTMQDHPVGRFLEQGILATIHSDDPAYFGGYLSANYKAVADALQLDFATLKLLAANSFKASFISDPEKSAFMQKVENYAILPH